MNHVIVYAHPNPSSFNHAIVDALRQSLQDQGASVVMRDLYALGFNPVLTGGDLSQIVAGNTPKDIAEEQKHISWADVVSFIYPLWWTGMPAIMKGYIDRVFTFGFAYTANESGIVKLLSGKKAIIISTQGTPASVYEAKGMFDALKKTNDVGIFDFVGMKVIQHLFLDSVTTVDDADRQEMLGKVKGIASSLMSTSR
jgi:NAD(P)H dehydrogenase (quinone)